MRWILALFLLCTTALVHADDGRRDPWVFRCVLDERARVIVAQLHPHFFAAYDAQSCSLFKAWIGEIDLTGSVYDTKHGPQPMSKGIVVFKQESLDLWSVTKGGKTLESHRKYVGYQIKDDVFTLLYAIELSGNKTISITETPAISVKEGAYTLTRTYEIKDLPEGCTLQLQNAGVVDPDVNRVDTKDGKTLDQAAVYNATVTADGAEMKDNMLSFIKSGHAVLTAVFAPKK